MEMGILLSSLMQLCEVHGQNSTVKASGSGRDLPQLRARRPACLPARHEEACPLTSFLCSSTRQGYPEVTAIIKQGDSKKQLKYFVTVGQFMTTVEHVPREGTPDSLLSFQLLVGCGGTDATPMLGWLQQRILASSI